MPAKASDHTAMTDIREGIREEVLPLRWPRLVTLGISIAFWRRSASYRTDSSWKPGTGLG